MRILAVAKIVAFTLLVVSIVQLYPDQPDNNETIATCCLTYEMSQPTQVKQLVAFQNEKGLLTLESTPDDIGTFQKGKMYQIKHNEGKILETTILKTDSPPQWLMIDGQPILTEVVPVRTNNEK
jgi:hypothetical protein